ncbi:hypothetical protein [Actinokineospora diospyrosa]|uniref:Cas3 C-terminal domain-containing protein n=1 Tax=Actinokineospora diospyrosa TaxID=103728 RepID=A0ABT1IC97_9PSEU|nr:hypothetical protein [Actinokineospora diospyrosa]MCP2270257.1 hypothetical protein [Actinokineospora diospyrosa]
MTSLEAPQSTPLTIPTVLLTRTGDTTATLFGGLTVDLTKSGPTTPADEEALRGSSLVLTTGDDLPHAALAQLRDSAIPVLFASSPWLREHRTVVLLDGVATLGSHTLRYDDVLGVVIT